MSVILASSTAAPSTSGTGSTLVLYSEHSFNPAPPTAEGDNSIALGPGAETSTSAPNSLAFGLYSLARHRGSVIHANGRFGTSGDIQHGRYLMRTVSVGLFPTEMFLDGTSGKERLILPDDSTWSFSIMVTGHRQDSNDGHAGYKFDGVIYRQAGLDTVSFQGSPVKTVIAESNQAWDININANQTYGALVLNVTGETSKIIRWAALIETLEVTN